MLKLCWNKLKKVISYGIKNRKWKINLDTLFTMKDYVETKNFLIEDLYKKNKEASFVVLEHELLFLKLGSNENINPLNSTAALFVKMLQNKELYKKGIDILNDQKSILTVEVK